MVSIYKRGIVFWILYYRNGKPYRESAKNQKENEAKRLLRMREINFTRQNSRHSFRQGKINDLADDFLTDFRINGKKSLNIAVNSVKNLKAFFDGDKIMDITTPRIQRYIECYPISSPDYYHLRLSSFLATTTR